MEKLNTTIRQLRFDHSMTQEQLAEQVGVARQTIVYLEKGEYMPSLGLAWRICRFFGKTLEEVFIFQDS